MSQPVERFDPSRRGFLRGAAGRGRPVQRPPWALQEALFIKVCTRCDACIDVCPERILLRGSGGFPELDFRKGGCTFCGDCLETCRPSALTGTVEPPFSATAIISESCLAGRGVICRACGDECEQRAIRFRLLVGGRTAVTVVNEACNGCGACIRFCPADAIRVVPESLPSEVV